MDVGLQISGSYEEALASARWAETEGFVAFALPDHYVGGLGTDAEASGEAFDGLIQLAGLARETDHIELSVLVSPITFRHPAVLAKTAVTIDDMSGGRFTLGVGTGWMEREHEIFGLGFPDRPTRFEMLEESLAYLRAAFDDSASGFDGRFFRLEPISVQPKPLGMRHLAVGAWGATKPLAWPGATATNTTYTRHPARRSSSESNACGRRRSMQVATRTESCSAPRARS